MKDAKEKNIKTRYRSYTRFLALLLTLALCMGMMPVSALAAEETAEEETVVTLDMKDGKIVIEPDGYTQGGGSKLSYTGAYVITGSVTNADTPLLLKNSTESAATYDITLDNASSTIPAGWCTAILMDGSATAGITVNLTNRGESEIYANTFAAIYNGSSQSLTVNLYIRSGQLTLGNTNGTQKVISDGVTLNILYDCTATSDGGTFNNNSNTTFVTSHTYTDNEDGTHSFSCDICEKVIKESHNLSYTNNGDGTHAAVCSDCSYSVLSEEHDEDGKAKDCGDGSNHITVCSGCGAEVATRSHTFGAGSVIKEPGEDEPGEYQVACTVCGAAGSSSSVIAPVGGYWICLYDDYGDGWNGASLSVYLNGEETRLTLEGYISEQGFFIKGSADDTIILVFHKGGYDVECGIELYAPGSSTVLYSRNDLNDAEDAGVLYSNRELADYSAVEEAIDAVPDDLSLYTSASRDNLFEAINQVIYYMLADSQTQVNGYAQDILDALDALEPCKDGDDPSDGALSLTISAGQRLIITSTGYRWGDDGEETAYTGAYFLDGNAYNASVLVESGAHFIVMDSLLLRSGECSPFALSSGSRVWLCLESNNSLESSGSDYAGLNVPSGSALYINGSGSLYAIGGTNGAGIGSNYYEGSGQITISGGTITAISETDGAGIGSGYGGYGGRIIINGGTVTATSNDEGAGIGGGNEGDGGRIIINGGTVTATSNDDGAGIGGGDHETGGQITITGGVITANSAHGNSLGNGDSNDTAEGETNFVTIDSASVFSDKPDSIEPAPRNSEGEEVFHQIFTSESEDGYAKATLSDGSIWLVYVKNNEISLYLPDGVTLEKTEDPGADYTAVDEAIDAAGQLNKDDYMDFSEVEDAIEAVDRSLYFDRQDDVQAMAQAIRDAIDALVKAHTLTFDTAGGSAVDEVTAAENTQIDLSEYTTTRDGYTFSGWNTAADGTGTSYAADGVFTITEDTTLYAVWTADQAEPEPDPEPEPESETEPETEPDTGTGSGTGNGTGGAADTGSADAAATATTAIAEGQVYDDGDYYYRVTSLTDMTAEVTGLKDTSITKIQIYGTVVLQGESFTVTSVASGAFKGNKNITSVTIKKNVVSIGANAFSGCTKLKTVNAGSTALTSIGAKAFSGCTSLKKVTIKSKVLKTIGKQAFKGDKKLTRITLKTTKLGSVGKKALSGINAKCVIKVPKAKKAAYTKLFKGKGQKSTVKVK